MQLSLKINATFSLIYCNKNLPYKYAFVVAGLYIKLILGDGERSNFLQLQKYIRLASDSDQLSMMVQDNVRNKTLYQF